jgi:inhibitor of cysteine peptidase
MTPDPRKRRTTLVSAGIFFLLAGMLILSGCTTQPAGNKTTTTATTAVPTTAAPIEEKDMKVYNETANGTTANIPLGSGGLIIRLAENPTTGYSWNATVTSGLAIVRDAYEADPRYQNMTGGGGTHVWVISGTGAGLQKFSAIYMRPWENVTGNESTFVLNVLVVKP